MANQVDQISLMLGRIDSRVAEMQNAQKEQSDKLDKFEQRIGSLELRAATAGGVTGTITSIAIGLITWNLRGLTGGS